MADLSKVQTRSDVQRRRTTNRDAVLPDRTITETPRFETNASLQSARRGDGGAEELMRIFGGLKDAAGSFADYTNASFKQKQEEDANQAVLDQAAGIVDPELEARSAAYRRAISTGSGLKGAYDELGKLRTSLDEALNNPEDPADLEDVQSIIEQHIKDFAVVDGKVRDFGSPEANMAVGKVLHEAQIKLVDEYREKITEQVNVRGLETAASNFATAGSTGVWDFEAALSQVPPGVDRKTAKASLIDTASAYAYSVVDEEPDKALGALDALLNSKQSNGTPSLSPKELEALRQQRRTLASQAEAAADRKHREMWEANHDGVLKRLAGVEGSPPTIPELRDMVREDKLDPQTGFRLISSIQSDLEAEARERARDAREAARDAADSPSAAEVAIIDAVFSGKSTPAQASAAANRAAAAGLFGTGKQRYQRLSNVRQNINVVLSMGKAQKDAIKDYVDDWKAEANRVVKERVPDVAKRAQARRDIEQWSKHLMLRGAREAINPSKDALGALRARAGSFSSSLSAKYGL